MEKSIYVLLSFGCLWYFSLLSASNMTHTLSPQTQLLLEAISTVDLETVVLVGEKLVEEDKQVFSNENSFSDLVRTFLFEESVKQLSYCFLFLNGSEKDSIESWLQSEIRRICERVEIEYNTKKGELNQEKQKTALSTIIRNHCGTFLCDINKVVKSFRQSINEQLCITFFFIPKK